MSEELRICLFLSPSRALHEEHHPVGAAMKLGRPMGRGRAKFGFSNSFLMPVKAAPNSLEEW
jgi:hypothetical protein